MRIALLCSTAAIVAIVALAGFQGIGSTTLAAAAGRDVSGLTRVSNSDELATALRGARAGDVIETAPGVYANITIKNRAFDKPVTIRGPGTLNDLYVEASRGLIFSDLTFQAQSGLPNQFRVSNSSEIRFRSIKFIGPKGVESRQKIGGLLVRGSRAISVRNSEFSDLVFGLSLLDNDNVEVSGNNFHDLVTDGVRGGGVSNLVISDNHFTDFYPAPGDHPDGIQLWTTNTTTTAQNITIARNSIVRGSGRKVQGIFLRDTHDQLPFHNVTIRDNIVLGGLYNGITVDGGKNVIISHNKVLGYPDMKSWIRTENIEDGDISDNVAQHYIRLGVQSRVKEQKNATQPAAEDKGVKALKLWRQSLATAPAP
ncbi:right-handed parallel beta-helix repeat-containing protein [Phenylobacterium sp.]|jgi:hypothetical protein|uniref:right-handed parallel beta-helix repeat-containing protein n=1 Tax=Phenylobacterium sp. TaxID=1871053 RepID=UPI0035B190C0